MDLEFQILHFYKCFNINILLIFTKKATIGNFMKNVVENVTPSTLFVPTMNFSQSPFKPEIPNFIPLLGVL